MTVETVCMPDVEGRGEVVELNIGPGEPVEKGAALLVLESDKASMEVPAPFAGTVVSWLVQLGDSVVTDQPLVDIRGAGVTETEDSRPQDEAGNLSPESVEQPAEPCADTKPEGTVYAGPATRRLARQLGVDLHRVTATGARQRVLKDDVICFARQQVEQAAASPDSAGSQGTGIPVIPAEDYSLYGKTEVQGMSAIARATATHMTRCWLNIPHVTLFDEVNISDLDAFRMTLEPADLGLARQPTLLAFVIVIVAKALQAFPQFNVAFDGDNQAVIRKSYIHIGVAVDSPAGLVVPVIRHADQKTVAEVAREILLLSQKARERTLQQTDMQGGCFTVSSMGAMGGTGFTPIINGPEVAILGIARSAVKPGWNGREFRPETRLPLCLSFDHRVLNGGDAGRLWDLSTGH